MPFRKPARPTSTVKRIARRRPGRPHMRRTLQFEAMEKRFLLAADWFQQDQVFAFDEATPQGGAHLGLSVAVDGDTMVVGARREDLMGGLVDAGAVYVFGRDDNGTPLDKADDSWQQRQKLTAPDATASDYFGWSVSVSGDTVVVGSRHDDDDGPDSGSAYVFSREGGAWNQQAKLTASDAAADDWFGSSVSVSGDTVVVGSYLDDDDGNASGSAYVFAFEGGAWNQQTKLTAADAAAGDYFGFSVSVSGDTMVVGSALDDDDGPDSGSAYVFSREGGAWSQQAKLTASDAAADDWFGSSVSVSGDTVVVGSYLDDDDGNASGSAYVFTLDGGAWNQQTKLTADDAAAGDYFGFSVSVSGDTVVVGTPLDDAAAANVGSAYVLVRSSGVWSQQAKLTVADGILNDRFGFAASVSGDTVVVGNVSDDVVDEGRLLKHAGSALVFSFDGGTWAQQDQVFAFDEANPQAGDRFGYSVAVEGDTMVIGSRHEDWAANLIDVGAVYVFGRDNNGTPLVVCPL